MDMERKNFYRVALENVCGRIQEVVMYKRSRLECIIHNTTAVILDQLRQRSRIHFALDYAPKAGKITINGAAICAPDRIEMVEFHRMCDRIKESLVYYLGKDVLVHVKRIGTKNVRIWLSTVSLELVGRSAGVRSPFADDKISDEVIAKTSLALAIAAKPDAKVSTPADPRIHPFVPKTQESAAYPTGDMTTAQVYRREQLTLKRLELITVLNCRLSQREFETFAAAITNN